MNIGARGLVATLFVGAVLLLVARARADQSWAVSSTGNWSTPACWSGNLVPASSDSVFVTNGGTATITQAGQACGSLMIGGTGNSTHSTVQLNAGSLTISAIDQELVGWMGPGAFVQSGGTNAVSGPTTNDIILGNGSSTGSGSYTLSGGSLFAYNLDIANLAQGAFLQSSGTCSVATQLAVGYGSSGSYSLQSGLLLVRQELVGYLSTGSFTQSGGTNVVVNRMVLGQNQGYGGSYLLQGGVLSFGTLSSGSGTASFTISGGTLLGGPASSCNVPIAIAPMSTAAIATGGGTLVMSAGLSGSGGLAKSGAGLLVLSGSDGYGGVTTVSAGVLEFLGANSVPNGASLVVGANASVLFDSMSEGPSATGNMLVVPEPSTLALFVVSFSGFVGYRKARRFVCRRKQIKPC